MPTKNWLFHLKLLLFPLAKGGVGGGIEEFSMYLKSEMISVRFLFNTPLLLGPGQARGETLVSLVIGMGIMLIAMSAFTSMINTQQVETKALTEKLASLEFTRLVTSELSSISKCSALLAETNIKGGTSSLTFDATKVTSKNPRYLQLNQIVGIKPKENVSPLSKSLIIRTNGILLKVTSKTKAELVIYFDQAKLVRPLKYLSFALNLQSKGPINNTTITGCGGDSNENMKIFAGVNCNDCPYGSAKIVKRINGGDPFPLGYWCNIKDSDGNLHIYQQMKGTQCLGYLSSGDPIGTEPFSFWSY